MRNTGSATIPEPVLQNYGNIERRDAVLAWDRTEPLLDENGKAVTRWDGETTKSSPVTGGPIADETARVATLKYVNPRKAEWPEADFVVGNPPYIGTWRMRQALGDGYAEALRKTHSDVPESADLVMFWWNHAAELAREKKIIRAGLITTNSISQAFQKRVVQRNLDEPEADGLKEAKPWPKDLPAQVAALREFFQADTSLRSVQEIAAAFKGAKVKDVEPFLRLLTDLGQTGGECGKGCDIFPTTP